MKRTIEAVVVGHDLQAGDAVYLVPVPWWKRVLNRVMFWKKPTLYAVTKVTENTFTYEISNQSKERG
ncbi:MAG: hypothetical protein HOE30_23290 [Deltaproteobacteria bacterium]|nr:hypothetical protein [Deltaproteobacteria bacterium]MBT4264780.1 hypothetical protein [Deltaproteobacteria bacterium]